MVNICIIIVLLCGVFYKACIEGNSFLLLFEYFKMFKSNDIN